MSLKIHCARLRLNEKSLINKVYKKHRIIPHQENHPLKEHFYLLFHDLVEYLLFLFSFFMSRLDQHERRKERAYFKEGRGKIVHRKFHCDRK